jgi:hypothetical protein
MDARGVLKEDRPMSKHASKIIIKETIFLFMSMLFCIHVTKDT